MNDKSKRSRKAADLPVMVGPFRLPSTWTLPGGPPPLELDPVDAETLRLQRQEAAPPPDREALAAKLEAGAELTVDERRQAAELLRRPPGGRPPLPPSRVLTGDYLLWSDYQAARGRGLGHDEAIEVAAESDKAGPVDSSTVRAAVARINKLYRRRVK